MILILQPHDNQLNNETLVRIIKTTPDTKNDDKKLQNKSRRVC